MKQDLQQIFTNACFVICFVDTKMRVIRINPAMEALTGIQSDEARGRHCYDCWGQYAKDTIRHGTERICDGCQVVAALRHGEKHRYELKIGDKIIELFTNPVRDLNGEIVGAMEVGVDITERKNAEDKLVQQRGELQQLSARLIETEENERRRIARELHDQIGQQLTALGLNLHILGQSVPAEQQPRIEDSLELIKTMTGQVRDIMTDLRPSVLDDYGLRAALRWYAPVFTKRTGVEVIVIARVPRLEADLETALFRIVQEALNNVLKHAQATRVEIHCSVDDNKLLSLAIHDNGGGIQAMPEPPETLRWGLLSMQERIEWFGGKLSVSSRPGGGTIISAEVQL